MARLNIFRDSIYVGQVIKPGKVATYDKNFIDSDGYQIEVGSLHIKTALYLRSMLFTVKVDGDVSYAQDLLYKSPDYLIANMSKVAGKVPRIVVNNAYPIGDMLAFLGYDSCISRKDVKDIRKKIFTDRFRLANSELFGYLKALVSDSDDPMDDEMYKLERNGFIREDIPDYNPITYDSGIAFIKSPVSELPAMYFQVLADNSSAFEGSVHYDAFHPTIEETGQKIKHKII